MLLCKSWSWRKEDCQSTIPQDQQNSHERGLGTRKEALPISLSAPLKDKYLKTQKKKWTNPKFKALEILNRYSFSSKHTVTPRTRKATSILCYIGELFFLIKISRTGLHPTDCDIVTIAIANPKLTGKVLIGSGEALIKKRNKT